MELELGLHAASTGARADVRVRAPDGATLADVTALLLARVLPPGRTGRLSVRGRAVDPATPLGSPPLVQGALVQVDGAVTPPPLPGLTELRVVGGPDAGAVHLLAPGELVVGRDCDATVRLDDPDVSRRHCRLRITHGGATVADLGSTNGTTVDGAPVGEQDAPLPPGAVLRVGDSSLMLTTAAEPAAPLTPAPGGRLAFNRPPRLRPPAARVQVAFPPPPRQRERTAIPLLAIAAPLALGVAMWQVTGSTTFLLFTLLSPLMALGNVVTERRSGRRRSRRDSTQWREQCEEAESMLSAAVRADEQARRAAWPDAAEVLSTAVGPRPRLWERRRDDEDFLDLRVGTADAPAQVQVDGDVPGGAATSRAVPVVVPLRESGVLGIAGERARAQGLARWVVAQAAVLHSPRDLQVVVLAQASAAAAWEWTRWLPHARPDGRQHCQVLLGLGAQQGAARVAELTALVEGRRSERATAARAARTDERPVLVVVDGARALRALPGLASVLADGSAVGVYAVCVDDDPRLLPEECGATAVLTGAATLVVQVRGRPDVPDALADLVPLPWAEAVARALAALRDDSRERRGSEGLPPSVRWSELVDLPLTGSHADAAAVVQRWATPGRSTTAVLGRGPDGVFTVDLARDGPHGLVAGTTGSGKSELLQTLIASLALSNRPDELTFVLVDYKGGAAFGPCARLPHTVGMVTDLDGSLVERALASLHAELSRREAVLADAGVKDIDDHRRAVGTPGGPTEVLPRLVLVVDEFASLVEELPDFVGGLVGIAMRGRSLGVHLVLATQRPEGVVSADIRANTNLRLCLAVTRESESRDVLDAPVAITISRTTPGRAYARTGHAELTPFQAARVGGRSRAVLARDEQAEVEVVPAPEVGDPPPRAASAGGDDDGSDLALLVDACVGAARHLQLPPQPSPWLPPLPTLVVVDDLPPADDPLVGSVGRVPPLSYGLVDVPAEQARRPLVLDLDASTHLMVLGAARAGRTTALRTLAGALASTTSPDDVHLYALDQGGGGLAPLAALPHVGAVVSRDQPHRVDRVLTWLGAEVARRQALLSAGGHADLAEQRAAVPPPERLPHLVLLLDRWEAFVAAFQDVDAGRLIDLVYRLLREGPGVGLHVVVSADRTGMVGRISSMVEDKLLLRMADRGDYAGAGLPTTQVPADVPPGRGWWMRGAPLVAQVALLGADPAGPAQAAALLARGLAAPAPVLHPPRRIELLPAVVHRSALPASTAAGGVVLGVGGDELDPVEVDLGEVFPGFLVGGPPRSGRSSTLLTVAEALRGKGIRIVAVAPRPSPLRNMTDCVTDRDASFDLETLLGDGRCALLVDDAELLVDSGLSSVLEKAVREARDTGTTVVAAGTTEELVSGYRGFVVEVRKAKAGVLLSPQSAADGDLLGVRLSRATGGDVVPGRGLLVHRGHAEPLQVAVPV